MKTKKGFFFTLIAITIISFMLYSITLWSTSIKEKETIYPKKLKVQNLIMFFNSIDNQDIQRFANISTHYALFKLANYSIDHPLPSSVNIKQKIKNLIWQGDAGSNYNYSNTEKAKWTFKAFKDNLESSCTKMGFECHVSDLQDFSFNQTDFFLTNYSFKINISMKDKIDNINLQKQIELKGNISLFGFPDPFTRYYKATNGKRLVDKQIFFNESSLDYLSNLTPEELADEHTQAYSWFYGPITSSYTTNDSDMQNLLSAFSSKNPKKYILRLEIINDLSQQDQQWKNRIISLFGAVLIENPVQLDKRQISSTILNSFTCHGTYQYGGPCTKHFIKYSNVSDVFEKFTINPRTFTLNETWVEKWATTDSGNIDPDLCDCSSGLVPQWTSEPYREHKSNVRYLPDYQLIKIPFFHNSVLQGSNEIKILDLNNDLPEAIAVNPSIHNSESKSHILFVSNNNDVNDENQKDAEIHIYNLNSLRDAVICQHYFKAPNQAPSYLDRFFSNGYQRKSQYGITSILTGQYFGGKKCDELILTNQLGMAGNQNSNDCEKYSRLDFEYVDRINGTTAIRGMLACKEFGMCNDFPSSNYLGRLYFSQDALNESLLNITSGYIRCDDTDASPCYEEEYPESS